MNYSFLSLSAIKAYEPSMRIKGVSEVARSPIGFLTAYKKVKGEAGSLSDYWRNRRDGFIARHMAQVKNNNEPLWKDGEPTRRHLALIAWAYSPTPGRLTRSNPSHDIEEVQEPLYHVTYYKNLEGIAESGLIPEAGESIGAPGLRFHKRNRVFLTGKGGILFWMSRAKDFAYYYSDAPAEDGLVSVVLRIVAYEDIEEDELGTRDSGYNPAYLCECEIDPEDIEVFDGGWWLPIEDWEQVNYYAGVDEDGGLVDAWKSPLRPFR